MSPSDNAHPLKYKELIQKLKDFGVLEKRQGRGSCIMLFKPGVEGRDQSYPIHPHGGGDEVNRHIIKALLRRFKIDPEKFW